MIVEVEMWAFRDAGKIREVDVPEGMAVTLDNVYHFGQNDFQPRKMRSVSCGDVIRLNGKRHMVWRFGFKEIPADFVPDTNDPLLGYR